MKQYYVVYIQTKLGRKVKLITTDETKANDLCDALLLCGLDADVSDWDGNAAVFQ